MALRALARRSAIHFSSAARELTDGYDLEQAMCNTHRATLDGLRELELDLHQHIHEENNVLFPRALAVA